MLPRAARLLNRRDFRAAYSRSRSYATARLVLYVRGRRPSAAGVDAAPLRVGFSISRKVCRKAHDRNRLKRRLREITRQDVLPFVTQGAPRDAVITARAAAAGADFATLRSDVARLFRQGGIVSAEAGST